MPFSDEADPVMDQSWNTEMSVEVKNERYFDERYEKLALEHLAKWCEAGAGLLKAMGSIYEDVAEETGIEGCRGAAVVCYKAMVKRRRVRVKIEEARLAHQQYSSRWVGDGLPNQTNIVARVDIENLPQDWPPSRSLALQKQFNAVSTTYHTTCPRCPTSPTPHSISLLFPSHSLAATCSRMHNFVHNESPIRARKLPPHPPREASLPQHHVAQPQPAPAGKLEAAIGSRVAQRTRELYEAARNEAPPLEVHKSDTEGCGFEPLY